MHYRCRETDFSNVSRRTDGCAVGRNDCFFPFFLDANIPTFLHTAMPYIRRVPICNMRAIIEYACENHSFA